MAVSAGRFGLAGGGLALGAPQGDALMLLYSSYRCTRHFSELLCTDRPRLIRRTMAIMLNASQTPLAAASANRQRSARFAYEGFKQFEDDLNKRLNAGLLTIHVVMVPIARDQLFPALRRPARWIWSPLR